MRFVRTSGGWAHVSTAPRARLRSVVAAAWLLAISASALAEVFEYAGEPRFPPSNSLEDPPPSDNSRTSLGFATLTGSGGPASRSLAGVPWTVGQATLASGTSNALTVRSFTGFVHAPLSATSSIAQTGGVLQLVAPTQIHYRIWLNELDGGSRFLPRQSMGWNLPPSRSRG